jgi:rod shape-determining protein MreB
MSGFLASLLRGTIYVQISPTRLAVRNPKTGESVAQPPEIAFAHESGRPGIAGVGHAARTPHPYPVEIVNPFAHPRTPISDFVAADALLRTVLRGFVKNRMFAASPRVVIHPLRDYEGGLTQVEIRALRELALGVGAAEAWVWVGPELTDAELLAEELPGTGRAFTS